MASIFICKLGRKGWNISIKFIKHIVWISSVVTRRDLYSEYIITKLLFKMMSSLFLLITLLTLVFAKSEHLSGVSSCHCSLYFWDFSLTSPNYAEFYNSYHMRVFFVLLIGILSFSLDIYCLLILMLVPCVWALPTIVIFRDAQNASRSIVFKLFFFI